MSFVYLIGLDWDDVLYLWLLFFSIGFGLFFRKFQKAEERKNIATLVGFLIVILACGRHIIHPIICTTINAIIITCTDKRIVHKVSFTFSFLYLILFRLSPYFGFPFFPDPTNLVMMIMTLKMVGLAFEANDAYVYNKKLKSDSEKPPEKRVIEAPSFTDVFHYGYCYLGVLAGPYYTYRTYCDLFVTPFWKYANCESVALKRFMYLPLYGVIFVVLSYYYPFSLAESSEFLNDTSIWYRLWFSFPSFAQFRMRMYIGMRLAEIVIIMGGLGAYPEICKPVTLGPTTNFKEITDLSNDEERASKTQYSFGAVYSIEPFHTEFETTVRASMKYWNMSVQCWLTNYIYLRAPKAYRTLITFVVSAVWHGISPGYFFAFVSVALFLPFEDIYRRKSKLMQVSPWVATFCWISATQLKLYLFSYWIIPFRLLAFHKCWNYLTSVYFLPTILSTCGMYGASLVIFKNIKTPKTANDKKTLVDSKVS